MPLRRCAHVRRHAHGFLAAGDHDVAVAVEDRLVAERDRPQAGAAELVHAPGRALDRDAGGDRGLPGRVLALTGGQDLAHDDLGDLRRPRPRRASARPGSRSCRAHGPEGSQSAPLKAPTGVRAALTMTMSSFIWKSPCPLRTFDSPRKPCPVHMTGALTASQGSAGPARPILHRNQGICQGLALHKKVARLRRNRLALATVGTARTGRGGVTWQSRRTDHHQEVRQPAALQHRHQHLRHARRPRRRW